MSARIASLPDRALVRVSGPDARPFLNGLVTQEVLTLKPGDLRFGGGWRQDCPRLVDWLDKFARATRAMPEILGAYRMTGDLDYLIHARVEDMADYDRLYQRLISFVELSDVSASFVMEELKETTEVPL